MTDRTELARLQRSLAEHRTHLRTASLVLAYSTAVFVLGWSATSIGTLGVVLLAVGSCGILAGTGWAALFGVRVAQHERTIRRMTQLPAARLLDR